MRVAPSFYRAHGLGNDYLVFEAEPDPIAPAWEATPAAVRAICHRWTGVGADGIVVLADPRASDDFPLRMYNPDGSEFERSGNGLRILASHLRRSARVDESPFTVRSGGARIGMRVHGTEAGGVYDVSVEMGRARVGARAVGFEPSPEHEAGRFGEGADETVRTLPHPDLGRIAFVPVSVGNPHAVTLGIPSDEALAVLGPFLSGHPAFTRGTNVQIAEVLGPADLRIAIWERGVGRTSASGTSSCASAVAAVHLGLIDPGPVTVRMPGGDLRVEVSPELDVVLQGPVREVAEGRLTKGFLDTLANGG